MNNNNDIGKTNPNGGTLLFFNAHNAGFGPDAFKDLYKNVKAKEAAATSREKTLEQIKNMMQEQDEKQKKEREQMERLNELYKKQKAEQKEKERLAKREEALEKIDEEYSTKREEAFKSLLQSLKEWGQI